ncbi:MAG: hypothetical protein HKN91_10280 [Acidimicrobiia bacterium]|nr:hypothetical protein [Acidimicrobiia bacterium]
MSDRYDDDFDPFDPYEDLMDLTGGESVPALEDPAAPQAPPPRSPLLTGLIVGLLLVVLSIAAFQLIGSDDEGDNTAASSTTTEAPDSSEPAAGSTTSTTEDPGDSSTTAPPDSAGVDLPDFVASGSPVAIADLTLAVDSIGPIQLGTSAPRSVGRLIASLGPPDEDSGAVISSGAFGSCEGDTERIVQWGPLVVVVIVDEDRTQTLGGYRLDITFGGFDSPTADLQTLSGLQLGASIAQLERIYDGFDIEYLAHPELDNIFELRSSNSGNLLLWGPISSADDSGFIEGIYSPDACGRFS